MKYRIEWFKETLAGGSFDGYFLVSYNNGWHFIPATYGILETRAGLYTFQEALNILDLYYLSVSSEDGGKKDFMRIVRKDGLQMYTRYSKYHPDIKELEKVLDNCVLEEFEAHRARVLAGRTGLRNGGCPGEHPGPEPG